MKITTNSVFIVEGKSDKLLLSQYFDSEIVMTNGLYVSHETISYLKELEKTHDMIVITDPDVPGETIAQRILQALPQAKRVQIRKKDSIKGGKLGLAETKVEPLLEKVMPLISFPKKPVEKLTLIDLLYFQQINPQYRKFLSEKFKIGHCNNKVMINRLYHLNVTKEMIESLING